MATVDDARLEKVRLVTTGAKTGQVRDVALYAYPDGPRLIVVGSGWAGGSRSPGWVHNLRALPTAVVRQGKRQTSVVAAEVPDGEERERLWDLACDAFPYYRRYQAETDRLIPVFVLTPTDE